MSLKPREVNFDDYWSKIHHTMNNILSSNTIEKAIWNDCFLDIYILCVASPESFADKLYEETKKYLINYVEQLKLYITKNGDEYILFNYYITWTKYNAGLKHIQTLFVYLNQQHIKKDMDMIYCYEGYENQHKYEIGELGLRIWKNIMLSPMINQLTQYIIQCLESDRSNPVQWLDKFTAPHMIRGCLQSFVTIDQYESSNNEFYKSYFEQPYLDLCAQYFHNKADELLQKSDINTYLSNITKILYNESERARQYLDPSTEPKVIRTIMTHMIENHLDYVHDECTRMLKQHQIEQLKYVYPLLRRVHDGLVKLLDAFYEYVKDEGLHLIVNLNGDNVHCQFVEVMLNLHDKYTNIIRDIFDNDTNFNRILDRCCAYIINYRYDTKSLCKSPGYLAKYCDILLKKSILQHIDDIEFDTKLDNAIVIFRYLDDKDYFHKFYSRLLAKRLIYQQSNMTAEELMINKLKNVCGYEFINKLHRMYTDICLSTDLNHKFHLYLMTKKCYLSITFQMHVLQTGAWPLQRIYDNNYCIPEFEKCVQAFERFYHNNYNGKKLTWLFNVSIAEIKLNYLNQSYCISLSTPHLMILLQFENVNQLTVNEILNVTTMSFDQFQRHLNGLIEYQLLLIDDGDNHNEINNDTKILLNCNFSYKRTKLRIVPISHKNTTSSSASSSSSSTGQDIEKGVCTSLEKDRKMYLQAAIVRIMKARKLLHHNELIQEILSQSKAQFKPSIQLIKSSIESLIEKSYLGRDINYPEYYTYSA